MWALQRVLAPTVRQPYANQSLLAVASSQRSMTTVKKTVSKVKATKTKKVVKSKVVKSKVVEPVTDKPVSTKSVATKPTKSATSKSVATKAKPTKAATTKSVATKPTTSIKNKSEDYERLSARDHVIRRPGMYIGATKSLSATKWIHARDGTATQKEITYVPGIVKLFDEILVNAADNVHRCPSTSTIKITANAKDGSFSIWNDGTGVPVAMHAKEKMWVPELVFGHLLTGSNFNDSVESFTGGRHGYGAKLTNIFSTHFEVETLDHKAGKVFQQSWNKLIPVGEAKVTDVKAKDLGMLPKGSKAHDYTKVTFTPDMAAFGASKIAKIDQGSLDVIQSRVWQLAAVLGDQVNVLYNNKRLSFAKSTKVGYAKHPQPFANFAEALMASSSKTKTAAAVDDGKRGKYLKVSPNCEIVVAPAVKARGGFHVSFVNGMETPRGGSHIDAISKQFTSVIRDACKVQGSKVTAGVAANELCLFVNCKVSNADFDSQTKDKLTSPASAFIKDMQVSEAFAKKFVKDSGIVDRLVSAGDIKVLVKQSARKDSSSGGRILDIPKLDDANLAGGVGGSNCTLILTEGDSAKALAVAGISVVGRDNYGVFPLKGKVLNVRGTSTAKVAANAEVTNLVKILGLRHGVKYPTDAKKKLGLRYGRVMLMTDQDFDGSHIKGLIINLFATFWPELMSRPGFLLGFVTPVIKAKRAKYEDLSFYSIREFEQWRKKQLSIGNDAVKAAKDLALWKTKYYKGLGTSTSAEARDYFRNLKRHTLTFKNTDGADSWETSDLFNMCFSKEKADSRKEWISQSLEDESTFFDHSKSIMTYDDFVNKELVLFSQYSNIRAIPNVLDGLKPSQRKIMYATFERFAKNTAGKMSTYIPGGFDDEDEIDVIDDVTSGKSKSDSKSSVVEYPEIKVAQLAGIVSEKAAYHHGEVSLHSSIVHMAQDYVGSNNLPLLFPSGQFGTRMEGGKDAASARYIFTRLQSYTRMLFPADDDALLEQCEDDGDLVEPVYYVPIIPLALVNGSMGIGTGWSTSILPRNLFAIIDELERRIQVEVSDNKLQANMVAKSDVSVPWYKGFAGTITCETVGVFASTGVVEWDSDGKEIHVRELPVGVWVETYKATLAKHFEGVFSRMREYHSEREVHFVLEVAPEHRDRIDDLADSSSGLTTYMRLSNKLSDKNMHMFSPGGTMKLYGDVASVFDDYFPVRYDLYERRRLMLLRDLKRHRDILSNRLKFAELITKREIDFNEKDTTQLVQLLLDKGLDPMSSIEARHHHEDDRKRRGGSLLLIKPPKQLSADFAYLLSRPLGDLAKDRRGAHQKKLDKFKGQIAYLDGQTAGGMWLRELGVLRSHLESSGWDG